MRFNSGMGGVTLTGVPPVLGGKVLQPPRVFAGTPRTGDTALVAEGWRIVCHQSGVSWPVLVRDLLLALGKDRGALARDRRVGGRPGTAGAVAARLAC